MRQKWFALLVMLPFLSCEYDGSSPVEPDTDFPTQAEFPSAKDLNGKLGKGINMGNALDAPIEGEWGVTLKAEYFRRVADSGFTTVRLPVRWSSHALSQSPYTIDSVFMDRVVWAVKQALDNKLHVVMDMHHYAEIYANPAAERKKFLGLWKQIAGRFAGYPPELLFEILNEPRDKMDAETWNEFLAEAIDTIRISNPKRSLVVGTAPWGQLSGLSGLKLPSDGNLIVTVHYYDPHAFTHQGVTFEAGADAWLGTTWRATEAQIYLMDNDIELIRKWAVENNRPIFMGEFGSTTDADSISRELWTHYIVRRFDSCGFSWALWNYNSDFGMVRNGTEKWNTYLANAMLHPERNPLLDSLLNAVSLPETTSYVVWADFENTYPELPTLAEKWADLHGRSKVSSPARWGTYYSDSSNVMTPEGVAIRNIRDSTVGTASFAPTIGNWGDSSRGLHVKARLLGGPYPTVGIGAGFLSGGDSLFADLTPLKAVQFRAKGRGRWFISIVTDSVQRDPVENWGNMCVPFQLEKEWKTFNFPVALFQPRQYSKQERDGLTWADVRKKSSFFRFDNQDYGKTANDSLEVWLDDVRLIGMKEADLGL